MKSRSISAAGLALLILALACGPVATPTPELTVPLDDLVGTSVALTTTAQAAFTEAAVPPSDTPAALPPSDTPAPLPTATDTPIPDATAPSPLPMTNTGIILNDDECYDLDNGNAPYVLDADCDILKVYPQILRPQNGALLSGYAEFAPPSLSDCMAKVYDAGDLAPNTDLYICFLSDEGNYGFIVQRPDGAPFEISSHRLVFDWWVFE